MRKAKGCARTARCLVVFAMMGAVAAAQAPQAAARLMHPAQAPMPAFEVATIKPNNAALNGPRFQLSPTGFNAIHASLEQLLQFAYVMKSGDQIVDAPKWSSSEFFDVEAKDSEGDVEAAKLIPMTEQMNNLRVRVQSLLADRFQLKAHFETRELPVYALVVAKGGIKMKEVVPDPAPAPGTPPQPGAHIPQLRPTGPGQITATAWPIGEMTVWLSHFNEVGNRIVVDETALKGNYDWMLNGVSQQYPEPTYLNGAPVDANSIFTILPEQLGLKLVPDKAPVEVLVIDHVEEPGAN
jgi:uncharacterized protein (TIGR03435 family)